MPINCPACGKAGQTEPACQRCGCDLSRLHEIAGAAGARQLAAHRSLANGDWADALRQAEQSWRLCHSAESAQLAFLAAAAVGETACALRWRERGADAETRAS